MDDETLIFSPSRGFWSSKGWSDSPRDAVRINTETPLQLNFQKTKDVRRIRLNKCAWLNKSGILLWALTLTDKDNSRPALRGHLNTLLGDERSVSKDEQKRIETIAEQLSFEALSDLIKQHSQSDIWACYEYNCVLIVPTDEKYPAEKAPTIPPYIFENKMKKRPTRKKQTR